MSQDSPKPQSGCGFSSRSLHLSERTEVQQETLELAAQLLQRCPMGLTFHSQLHSHLAGTTAIASFTRILALVLLTDSVNDKAESPPHSTVQQEAAAIGDGLPVSVPCHLGLWVAPDLQEKETVRISVL